jgi:hypothetical protein
MKPQLLLSYLLAIPCLVYGKHRDGGVKKGPNVLMIMSDDQGL